MSYEPIDVPVTEPIPAAWHWHARFKLGTFLAWRVPPLVRRAGFNLGNRIMELGYRIMGAA